MIRRCGWGFHVAVGMLLTVALASGCGGAPAGRRIRFVTATEADLRAADTEDLVWLEFRKGDEVPVGFLLVGVVEGVSQPPVHARASRTFYLVLSKHGPPRFSFDGKTILDHNAGRAAIALGRAKDEKNQVGVVVFLGNPEDAPPELKATN